MVAARPAAGDALGLGAGGLGWRSGVGWLGWARCGLHVVWVGIQAPTERCVRQKVGKAVACRKTGSQRAPCSRTLRLPPFAIPAVVGAPDARNAAVGGHHQDRRHVILQRPVRCGCVCIGREFVGVSRAKSGLGDPSEAGGGMNGVQGKCLPPKAATSGASAEPQCQGAPRHAATDPPPGEPPAPAGTLL